MTDTPVAMTTKSAATCTVDGVVLDLDLPWADLLDLAIGIRRTQFTVRLVRMGDQNFFSAMRDKLMWGTEIRL